MIVRRHGHFSPHVVFLLEGEVSFDGRRCPAGTHIELPRGAAFGPVVAGPEGAVMFEVMMGDPRSWGDEPEAYEAALAAQGAEALPDPPLEFPGWLADPAGALGCSGDRRDSRPRARSSDLFFFGRRTFVISAMVRANQGVRAIVGVLSSGPERSEPIALRGRGGEDVPT